MHEQSEELKSAKSGLPQIVAGEVWTDGKKDVTVRDIYDNGRIVSYDPNLDGKNYKVGLGISLFILYYQPKEIK